jgi:hypothetical protein
MKNSAFNIKLRAPTPCTRTLIFITFVRIWDSGSGTEAMKFRSLCNHRPMSIDGEEREERE